MAEHKTDKTNPQNEANGSTVKTRRKITLKDLMDDSKRSKVLDFLKDIIEIKE